MKYDGRYGESSNQSEIIAKLWPEPSYHRQTFDFSGRRSRISQPGNKTQEIRIPSDGFRVVCGIYAFRRWDEGSRSILIDFKLAN